MSDIEYVSIDRDELKRLQADSEELANLLAAQQQADPVMQVSSEVSKQISKRGRDAIMAAERLVTLDESKTVSLEDMESRFGVEPATHSEDGREVPEIVAELILGGIDGDELGDNDIVVHSNIVEGLQDRMVKDCDDVLAPLMTVAQHSRITKQLREEAATAKARQDHAEMVGDDLSRIVAALESEINALRLQVKKNG